MKVERPYNECFGYYYIDNYCNKCRYKKECKKKAKKNKVFEEK